jgi:uncharacterized protein (DUF2164 family)
MIQRWKTGNKALNQKCIDEVISRVQDISVPDQVGVIAAQDIIDIVLENMGPDIYNKAIDDTTKLLQEKLQDIEYDVEALKQP